MGGHERARRVCALVLVARRGRVEGVERHRSRWTHDAGGDDGVVGGRRSEAISGEQAPQPRVLPSRRKVQPDLHALSVLRAAVPLGTSYCSIRIEFALVRLFFSFPPPLLSPPPPSSLSLPLSLLHSSGRTHDLMSSDLERTASPSDESVFASSEVRMLCAAVGNELRCVGGETKKTQHRARKRKRTSRRKASAPSLLRSAARGRRSTRGCAGAPQGRCRRGTS